MKNDSLKNIIVIVCILLAFSVLYSVIDKVFNKKLEEIYLKNYEVNEYIPTYISDEQMAEIYLNHYVHTLFYDNELAYKLLDEEYRNKKYGNFDNFKNYINSLNYTTYKLKSFYVQEKQNYKIFGVYDNNGNVFIFKTNGVMQYTVYLDDYTVEI